ncbi:MAG: DUF1801 domain-containing protein [Cyclobacteriaceae bacterium]
MQYEAKTPKEYIDGLEDDWRMEKVEELRQMILSKDESIVEGINYKMLCYGDSTGIFFHLNAQKNYVSLYLGNASKVDKAGALLAGIDAGKGCLRFKKATDISATRLDEFISKTIEMWKNGEDIYC